MKTAYLLTACLGAALLAACGGGKSLPLTPSSGLTPGSDTRASGDLMHTNVKYETIFRFKGTDGHGPVGNLTYANSLLYGTTYVGGKHNAGTVFKIATNGTGHEIVHNFNHEDNRPSEPASGLLYAKGALYGTTRLGNGQYGAVYSIALSGPPYALIYGFGGSNGKIPRAEPTFTNDKLYGTTSEGESANCGGIFEMSRTGKDAKTVALKCTNGKEPWAQLLDDDGFLYGTARFGGAHGLGTIFLYTSGVIVSHFSFSGKDGAHPAGALISVDNMLYGTTERGGQFNRGTLFRVDLSLKEKPTVLHDFDGSDGEVVIAGVINVKGTNGKGTLYGTTVFGGKYKNGTLYKISTDGTGFTVLHDFGGPGDGKGPSSSLIYVNGTLYGTTVAGGDGESTCKSPVSDQKGCGTIFSLSGI